MINKLLGGLVLAILQLLLGGTAMAQYPDKPIRIILPFASGQGTDVATRLVMAEVSKKLGQPIVIDNRPGAGGVIAIQAVQKAAPDGYTILGFSSSFLSNGVLQKAALPYDLQRDFTPILRTVDSSVVLVAHPDVPVRTLADVLDMARRQPDGLPIGTGGIATTMHIALEILKQRANVNLVHVPYKGDPPAVNDVMGGQLKFTIAGFAAALPHIRAGKLRPIAISSASRIEALPDIPTIAESGFPGFELIGWLAYMVPAGTPQPVVDKLYTVIRTTIEEKEVRDRMANLGMFVSRNQKPADFKNYVSESQTKIETAIKAANIKPE
jgi:tripartite-type tricarboxylate transporter receptor subunit TctC